MSQEYGMYAIYDELTEQYGAPVIFLNDKVALKSWKTFVSSKKSEEIEGQHFVRIGSYIMESGEVINLENNQVII